MKANKKERKIFVCFIFFPSIDDNTDVCYKRSKLAILTYCGAQIKQFKDKDVIVFSLAEDIFIKGEQKTIWYDIYLNNARNPEKLSEALKQGRLIMVNGTLRVGTWTTNSGNVLLQQSNNVENVTFIRSGGSKQLSNDDYNVSPLEEPEHQVFNDQEELPF